MSAKRLQNATALLRRFVTDRKISGAVAAVASRGKVVYLEPVGLQSFETRAPMTERSLFRIYSMTKAVTAVAVMMLNEEGRFRLTDPVANYLPEFKDVMVQEAPDKPRRRPAREITVEDLLLHTSGLSHRTSDLYRRLQVRARSIELPRFVTNITRAPLMEDPGTGFRYSEATTVLGRLVEVWSGSSFDAFVTARILRPLGMSDTSFWVEPDARARLVTVYQSTQGGPLAPFEIEEVPFTERPKLFEGAVGLVSTAPDFLRFSQMLLNKGALGGVRLLSARTVETMTKNGLPDQVLQQRGGAMGWGLGNVDVVVTPHALGYLTAVGEYGWDGSAGTFFAIDPAQETIVILMTQNLPASPDGLRQKFKAAIQQSLIGQIVRATQTGESRAPRNLAEFDEMFQRIKNWGRWGADDQLGSANLVTDAKRKQAVGLAKTGLSVSLSHNLLTEKADDNGSPFEHTMLAGNNLDNFRVSYHGYAHSHIDALCHILYKDQTYNGYARAVVNTATGCTKLGIDNLKQGVITRGILIDIPLLRGLPFLEPGTAVYVEDLEAWEKKARIKIGPGDAILLRTGRWARRDQTGPPTHSRP